MTNPFIRRWWVGESHAHEHMSWSKDLGSLKREMSGSPDAEFFEVAEIPSEGMGLAIHEEIMTEVADKAATKWAKERDISLDSDEVDLARRVGLACAKSQLEGNSAALKYYKTQIKTLKENQNGKWK